MSTFWSYEKAPTSALGSSSLERANLTPRAEPWLAGLTTSGNPSALSMSDSSAAAPSSLIDSSRSEWKTGVGTPASRIRYLARPLSVQRVHAAGPEPVYGIPIASSSCWIVPSSPSRPCSAMNAASGRARCSSATSSGPTSSAITSCPSRVSASWACAPERSDTLRSSERPPLSTATLRASFICLQSSSIAPPADRSLVLAAGQRHDIGQRGVLARRLLARRGPCAFFRGALALGSRRAVASGGGLGVAFGGPPAAALASGLAVRRLERVAGALQRPRPRAQPPDLPG